MCYAIKKRQLVSSYLMRDSAVESKLLDPLKEASSLCLDGLMSDKVSLVLYCFQWCSQIEFFVAGSEIEMYGLELCFCSYDLL